MTSSTEIRETPITLGDLELLLEGLNAGRDLMGIRQKLIAEEYADVVREGRVDFDEGVGRQVEQLIDLLTCWDLSVEEHQASAVRLADWIAEAVVQRVLRVIGERAQITWDGGDALTNPWVVKNLVSDRVKMERATRRLNALIKAFDEAD